MIKSINAYWDPDKPEVIELLNTKLDQLSNEQLIILVKELDRRFMQLWDKVTYERVHGFVNYKS